MWCALGADGNSCCMSRKYPVQVESIHTTALKELLKGRISRANYQKNSVARVIQKLCYSSLGCVLGVAGDPCCMSRKDPMHVRLKRTTDWKQKRPKQCRKRSHMTRTESLPLSNTFDCWSRMNIIIVQLPLSSDNTTVAFVPADT